jgi:hypothetical protein
MRLVVHLLKRKAQSLCELFLGHSLHLPPHSYTITNAAIGCVR